MEIDQDTLLKLLDMRFSSLTQTTDETVWEMLKELLPELAFAMPTGKVGELFKKYQKLRRLEDLVVKSLSEGICDATGDLNWKEIHHRGWLCENDYVDTFKNELQGLDPKKWQERN